MFHDAAIPPDDFVANCTISFEELAHREKDQQDFWVNRRLFSFYFSAYSIIRIEYLCKHDFVNCDCGTVFQFTIQFNDYRLVVVHFLPFSIRSYFNRNIIFTESTYLSPCKLTSKFHLTYLSIQNLCC